MAARCDEAGAWRRNGAKSAEDDIVRKAGTPTGSARRTLNTSKRLKRQPETDEAVRRGDVSPDQANEVCEIAGVGPVSVSAVRAGCGATYPLDIDHNEGWTLTYETKLDDLSWLCGHCHDLKTRNDLRLVGPAGRRRSAAGACRQRSATSG